MEGGWLGEGVGADTELNHLHTSPHLSWQPSKFRPILPYAPVLAAWRSYLTAILSFSAIALYKKKRVGGLNPPAWNECRCGTNEFTRWSRRSQETIVMRTWPRIEPHRPSCQRSCRPTRSETLRISASQTWRGAPCVMHNLRMIKGVAEGHLNISTGSESCKVITSSSFQAITDWRICSLHFKAWPKGPLYTRWLRECRK